MRQAWPAEDTVEPVSWWPLAVFVLALAWGYALGYWAGTEGQPYCPQEDSCVVDYRDGHWIVQEVTP